MSQFKEYPNHLKIIFDAVASSITNSKMKKGPPSEESMIFEKSVEHGVAPIVFPVMKETYETSIPPGITKKFESYMHRFTMKQLKYSQEIDSICRCFTSSGIRAVPYKGPVISEKVYKPEYNRDYLDIDFLVSRDDIIAAGDALMENGYKASSKFLAIKNVGIHSSLIEIPSGVTFKNENRDIVIDLNWGIKNSKQRKKIPFERLWQNRITTTLFGNEVPCLSPIDRLIVVAIHGLTHSWHSIKWIADFAHSLSFLNSEAEKLMKAANSCNAKVAIYTGILLCSKLFQQRISSELNTISSKNRRASCISNYVLEAYKNDPIKLSAPKNEHIINILGTDNLYDMTVLSIKKLFQPNIDQYQARQLNPILWPVYIPMKLFSEAREIISFS